MSGKFYQSLQAMALAVALATHDSAILVHQGLVERFLSNGAVYRDKEGRIMSRSIHEMLPGACG